MTAVLPGVRYDGIQVNIVKRHIAFENFEDEDYDPVLLLDEYSRQGEEQRQEIESVAGWLMSLQDVRFLTPQIHSIFICMPHRSE